MRAPLDRERKFWYHFMLRRLRLGCGPDLEERGSTQFMDSDSGDSTADDTQIRSVRQNE